MEDSMIEIYSHLGRNLDLNRRLRERQSEADELTHRRLFGHNEPDELYDLLTQYSDDLDMIRFIRRRYPEIEFDFDDVHVGSGLSSANIAVYLYHRPITWPHNRRVLVYLNIVEGRPEEALRLCELYDLAVNEDLLMAISGYMQRPGYLTYLRDFFRRKGIHPKNLIYVIHGMIIDNIDPPETFMGIVNDIATFAGDDQEVTNFFSRIAYIAAERWNKMWWQIVPKMIRDQIELNRDLAKYLEE